MKIQQQPTKYSHFPYVLFILLSHFLLSISRHARLVASSRPSVRPHGTIRLPLDGFWWKFIFEDFSKICREYSGYIKIWQVQRILYVNSYVHFWSYVAKFFLEWKTLQTKAVQKLKTHLTETQKTPFMYNKVFPFENRAVYETMWEILQSGAGHRWQHGGCALRAGYLMIQTHTQNM